MPSYPSVKTDRVYYDKSDNYADQNLKLTLLDGSILEIWGEVYYNGVLLGTGGGGGISGITVKEDSVSLGGTYVSINFTNGLDVSALLSEVTVVVDLGEYSGTALPNAKVAGLGSLATKSSISTADIANDAVDNTKLANMAANSIRGNNTGSVADPRDLTVAETKTLLAITEADVTNLVTDLSNKQPIDTDLTTIAGLTATTGNIIQSVGSAWASQTPVQVKTSLSLDQVNNTSDATQDAATSTLTNKTLTAPIINLAINAQTGTTYTLVLTDNGKLLTHSNAAAITVTVPLNSSVAFPVGSQVTLAQIGAGKVTVAATGGVTVNATPSLGFRAQYSSAALIKTATDTWLLVGDLA